MNREVFQEGWLIKSPPTKRIWRARWRRRWFTLKQGEIPGQYCLEYYTDRNCRKLKGTIDLDQCEQVDCGLRLEHRKQKFQFMFDVKTPRRTFYLAAETELDMHDWVNCICQVCNLQDLSKPSGDRNYYNIGHDTLAVKTVDKSSSSLTNNNDISTETQTTTASTSTTVSNTTADSLYENEDFTNRQLLYTNRDTVICDSNYFQKGAAAAATGRPEASIAMEPKSEYYNFSLGDSELATNAPQHAPPIPPPPIERSHSMSISKTNPADGAPFHARTRSMAESRGTPKKIPDNLKLTDTVLCSDELSPALSTASGPYISISECFSGTATFHFDTENPTTPLNSLDPRFYDTPRSRHNIGLNLMHEPPYSPKRNNYAPAACRPKSGRSSPSDSESVFTDEEEWPNQTATTSDLNRSLRPSDSSVENDSMAYTYTQRFSKIPNELANKPNAKRDIVGPWISSNATRQSKAEAPSSDTENASPAIGPKDINSCVEENYDIPRSHQMPYYTLKQPLVASTHLNMSGLVATSTPNLLADIPALSSKDANYRHFYTNAAPTTRPLEGNVFRYDFVDQESAPKVNRGLKPKASADEPRPQQFNTLQTRRNTTCTLSHQTSHPPSIDRKLKPNPNESFSQTLPRNYNNSSIYNNSSTTITFSPPKSALAPSSKTPSNQPVLDYLELDTSSAPPICQNSPAVASGGGGATSATPSKHTTSSIFGQLSLGKAAIPSSSAAAEESSIVYKSVDFIKTEAIKRTRQDRAQNTSSHFE